MNRAMTDRGPDYVEEKRIGGIEHPVRTSTKILAEPRLEIGRESFAGSQVGAAEVHTHEDGHSGISICVFDITSSFRRPLGLPRTSKNL